MDEIVDTITEMYSHKVFLWQFCKDLNIILIK